MLESVAERSAVEPVRMAIMASRSARRNLAVLVAHVTPPARDPVEQRAGGVHAAISPRPTATPARERAMATEVHPTRSDRVTSGFKKC